MPSTLHLVALLLWLSASSLHAATEPAMDPEAAAIGKTRDSYVAAWRAGNAKAVASLYTVDALVLYPNHPAVSGNEAILGYFSGFFMELEQESFSLVSSEVQVAGRWAFDRGAYTWKAKPRQGGDSVEDNGKYLVILEKQADGTWKIARDMDNSDRPLTQAARGTP